MSLVPAGSKGPLALALGFLCPEGFLALAIGFLVLSPKASLVLALGFLGPEGPRAQNNFKRFAWFPAGLLCFASVRASAASDRKVCFVFSSL